MIFPHTCMSCGRTTEPKLITVGSVVNVCCAVCQAHIRYCQVSETPIRREIMQAIWQISDFNLPAIQSAKLACIPNYWSLYLHLLRIKKVQ